MHVGVSCGQCNRRTVAPGGQRPRVSVAGDAESVK